MEGLVLGFGGKSAEECPPPASHTPREGRGARTDFLRELQGFGSGTFNLHSSVLPHSHVFHRVRGRRSVLVFRRTLVKHNGLRVGQTEPVGPHDL